MLPGLVPGFLAGLRSGWPVTRSGSVSPRDRSEARKLSRRLSLYAVLSSLILAGLAATIFPVTVVGSVGVLIVADLLVQIHLWERVELGLISRRRAMWLTRASNLVTVIASLVLAGVLLDR